MTGSPPTTAHLALHPADCLGLVAAPAEQSALGPLEGDVLRVEEGLDEGRGEAVLHLQPSHQTSDLMTQCSAHLVSGTELERAEVRLRGHFLRVHLQRHWVTNSFWKIVNIFVFSPAWCRGRSR